MPGRRTGGPAAPTPPAIDNGFPKISISGYANLGDNTGGMGIDRSRAPQFVDNVSLIRGRHGFKAGVDIRPLSDDANTTNTPSGILTFTSDISGDAAAAYMMGFPRSASTPEGVTVSGVRQQRYGFYAQDDWHVNSRLTLNLGIRYDLNLLPHDIYGVSRTL